MASGFKQIFMIYIAVAFIVVICNAETVYWINRENLEPITMRYYPQIGFFTGSQKQGTIYQLKVNGTSSTNAANPMNFTVTDYFSHPSLNFSTGFEIDFDRNLLFICHSNPNVLTEWSSPNGTTPAQWPSVYGFMSGIMIVNLTTAQIIDDIDLQNFNINKSVPLYHYANDINFDSKGNGYITDTCGGAIYKLANNNGSYTVEIFSYDPSWFSGNIPMLNGIALDPQNEAFLLVNALTTSLKDKGNSAMWKVPMSDPMRLTPVNFTNVIGIPLGFDGQMFSNSGDCLYVAQESLGMVYQFITSDNWDSLILKHTMKTKGSHPTSLCAAETGIFGTELKYSVFVCSSSGSEDNVMAYPIELFDFPLHENDTIIYKNKNDKDEVVYIIMYCLIGACTLLVIALIVMCVCLRRYVNKKDSANYPNLLGKGLDSPPDNIVPVN